MPWRAMHALTTLAGEPLTIHISDVAAPGFVLILDGVASRNDDDGTSSADWLIYVPVQCVTIFCPVA